LSRSPAVWLCAAALLLAAACGSSPGAATQSPSPAASASASGSATPSSAPSPSATFALNPVNSTIKASGKILLTKGAGVFTVELQITGLQAGSSHVSHVHVGSCKNPGGIKFALNQVVADGTGAADTRTQVPAAFPASTHWYVVVHEGPDMQGSNAQYMLCGNLF
jgi:hypothetical protein